MITFLSLKKNKVNVRYGPGFDYEVKYIYRKVNLPVKVIDKKENFRKIIDSKKEQWMDTYFSTKKVKIFHNHLRIKYFSKTIFFSKPIARIQKGRLLINKKCKKKIGVMLRLQILMAGSQQRVEPNKRFRIV